VSVDGQIGVRHRFLSTPYSAKTAPIRPQGPPGADGDLPAPRIGFVTRLSPGGEIRRGARPDMAGEVLARMEGRRGDAYCVAAGRQRR